MIDPNDLDFLINNHCITDVQAERIAQLYGWNYTAPQQRQKQQPVLVIPQEQTPILQKNSDTPAPTEDTETSVSVTSFSLPPAFLPYVEFIKRNYLAVILSLLGALLTLGGLSTLVSVHWYTMPAWVKMLGGILLMFSIWAAGFHLHEINRKFPKTSYALYMLGAGMWAVNIKLYSFLYHVVSTPAQGVLTFLLGILPLPFIIKIKGLLLLVIGTAFLWGFLSIADPAFSWSSPLVISAISLAVWSMGEVANKALNGYYRPFSRLSIIIGKISFAAGFPLILACSRGPQTVTGLSLALLMCGVLFLSLRYNRGSPSQTSRLQWPVMPIAAAACILAAVFCTGSALLNTAVGLTALAYFARALKQNDHIDITASSLMAFVWAGTASARIHDFSFSLHAPIFFLIAAPILLGLINRTGKPNLASFKHLEFVIHSIVALITCFSIFSVSSYHIPLPTLAPILTAWCFALYVSLQLADRGKTVSAAVIMAVITASSAFPATIPHYIAILVMIGTWAMLGYSKEALLSTLILAISSLIAWNTDSCFFILAAGVAITIAALKKLEFLRLHQPESGSPSTLLSGYVWATMFICLHVIVFREYGSPIETNCILFTALTLFLWMFAELKTGRLLNYSLLEWIHKAAFAAMIPATLLMPYQYAIFSVWLFIMLHFAVQSFSTNRVPSSASIRNSVFLLTVAIGFSIGFIDSARQIIYELDRFYYLFPIIAPLFLAAITAIEKNMTNRETRQFPTWAILLPCSAVFFISLFPFIEPWPKHVPFLLSWSLIPWIAPMLILLFQGHAKLFRLVVYTFCLLLISMFLPLWVLLAAVIAYCALSLGIGKKTELFHCPPAGLVLALLASFIIIPLKTPLLAVIAFIPWLTGWLLRIPDSSKNTFIDRASPFIPAILAAAASLNLLFPEESPIPLAGILIAASTGFLLIQGVVQAMEKKAASILLDSTLLAAIILSSFWWNGWISWSCIAVYGLFRLFMAGNLYKPSANAITAAIIALAVFCTYPAMPETRGQFTPCFIFYILLLVIGLYSCMRPAPYGKTVKIAGGILIAYSILLCSKTILFFPYGVEKGTSDFLCAIWPLLPIPALFMLRSAITGSRKSLWLLAFYTSLILFYFNSHAVMYWGMALACLGMVLAGVIPGRGNADYPAAFLRDAGWRGLFALPFVLVLFDFGPWSLSAGQSLFIFVYSVAMLIVRGDTLQTTPPKKRTMLMIMLVFLIHLVCYVKTEPGTDGYLFIGLLPLAGIISAAALWKAATWKPSAHLILFTFAITFVPAACFIVNQYTAMILLVAWGAILIYFGLKKLSSPEINSGVILIALVALAFSFNLIDSIEERGLSLLISGVTLLILSFVTEKMRRSLIKQLEQNDKTPL